MNNSKVYTIYIFVLVIGAIYVLRLFQMQVLDDKYASIAERISLRKQTLYPQRGLVFDRNEKLLVYNEAVYDLMLSVPIKLQNIDTLSLCKLLEIEKIEFDTRLKKAKATAYAGKSVFKKSVSRLTYARLQERLFEFKGFFFEIRQDRNYKYNSAAHLLGYLGEISRRGLEEQEEKYYEMGDYLGKKGIERFYETDLRGAKGEKYYYVDRKGVNRGSYKNGDLDKISNDGKNLVLSIDIDLQMYGEKLLSNKLGSIVAIEPSTGEILAAISSPFYDPSNFNIQNRGSYYNSAITDPTKPIFNRSVSAPYPPGSTFKPLMALIGLQDGAINADSYFGCSGYYKIGKRIIRCHMHGYNTSLQSSIANSCNTYYCHTFKNMMQSSKYGNTEEAYHSWTEYLRSFGVGDKLGVDISSEARGWLYGPSFYNRMYGEGAWSYARILSLSFGQGELGLTPLQIANVAASIANRGYFYTPHVVKQIQGMPNIPEKYLTPNKTMVESRHFVPVIEGMYLVTLHGTASKVAIRGMSIAGKTGTVQNPHGKNHSAYMAFAPVNDPKIALAVFVEEAGYGANWAAPIAHLMIENYLNTDSVFVSSKQKMEKKMLQTNLIPAKFKGVER